MIRAELLGMTPEEASRYLAYVKRAGCSPAAVAEAEELVRVLSKADPRLDALEKASEAAVAEVESLRSDPSLALAQAEAFAKSGTEPTLEPRRFEDSMLAVAAREKRESETVEKCFARLGRRAGPRPPAPRSPSSSRPRRGPGRSSPNERATSPATRHPTG